MRHDFPGLLAERLPSGATRYRVRVEGDKRRRIPIPVGPDHPDFGHHYQAARLGDRWAPAEVSKAEARSLQWLVDRYIAHLKLLADTGQGSPRTLKQRRSLLTRLCAMENEDGDTYGECHMDAPRSAFVAARDRWRRTPAEADNLMKAARSMYRWAIDEAEIASANPVEGIKNIHKSRGGAKAWTASDLRKFRDKHPAGTTAHLWLTLSMFTACRIGDAVRLGRSHEVEREGMIWLAHQPAKKGSAPVEIPLLPPLYKATRAQKVQGPTYILSEQGRPFKTMESLRERVRKWCDAAGLPDLSAHGVRKATAELLAEAGCTQHQIMAIMAHTQAKTSEIYTKGVQRRILASDAMAAFSGLEW